MFLLLHSHIAQEEMKALAGPTGNAPPGPDNGVSLSFEAGFGSVEQRALVDDFEAHASQASRLLLKAGVVTETRVSQYVDSALLVGSRQRVVVCTLNSFSLLPSL